MKATLDKSAAEWIGYDLQIDAEHLDLPQGVDCPEELELEAVHVHSSRGIYLGRRWYLQAPGTVQGPRTFDLVSPAEIAGSLTVCERFLAQHGYRWVDYPGSFEYRRLQKES